MSNCHDELNGLVQQGVLIIPRKLGQTRSPFIQYSRQSMSEVFNQFKPLLRVEMSDGRRFTVRAGCESAKATQ